MSQITSGSRSSVCLKRNILRNHIARHGYVQHEFAKKIGVSPGYCSQLLAGDRQPSGRVRARMLKVVDLGFEDLFEFKGNSSPPSG